MFVSSSSNSGYLAKERILDDVIRNANYSTLLYPNTGTGVKIQVEVFFVIVKLIELTNNGLISLAAGLTMRWSDERLKWNTEQSSDFCGINVPVQNIWTPKITLMNSGTDGAAIELDRRSTAGVFTNGHVVLNLLKIFSANCELDLTYFPFDSQNCSFFFADLEFDLNETELITFRTPLASVNTELMSSNGEFTYVDSSLSNGTALLNFFKTEFPTFTVTVKYSRNPCYYVTNVAVPSALLLFASGLIFFLPSDTNVKITMACSLMIALYVLQQAVSQLLPASQDTPILATGIMSELALGCFSVLCAVLTVTLRNVQPRLNNCCVKLVATVDRLLTTTSKSTTTEAKSNQVRLRNKPEHLTKWTSKNSNNLTTAQSVKVRCNEKMEFLMKAVLQSVDLQCAQAEAAAATARVREELDHQWRILDFVLNMFLFAVYSLALIFICLLFLFHIIIKSTN